MDLQKTLENQAKLASKIQKTENGKQKILNFDIRLSVSDQFINKRFDLNGKLLKVTTERNGNKHVDETPLNPTQVKTFKDFYKSC